MLVPKKVILAAYLVSLGSGFSGSMFASGRRARSESAGREMARVVVVVVVVVVSAVACMSEGLLKTGAAAAGDSFSGSVS